MRLIRRMLNESLISERTRGQHCVRVYVRECLGGTSIVRRVCERLVRNASKLLRRFLSRFLHLLVFLHDYFGIISFRFRLLILITNGRTSVIIL